MIILSGAATATDNSTPEVEFDGRNLTGSSGDPITTWEDSSGNNRDATTAAGPKVEPGVLNGHPVSRWDGGAGDKLDFTGVSASNFFTIIAVVKCTDSNTRTIMAEGTGGNGPPRFHIAANKIQLVEDDNVTIGTSTTSLNTTSFYTVAVTYDNVTGAVFYLNGSADGTSATTSSFTRAISRVGCRSGNQNTFLGDIAYVAYWNSVLSSGELTSRFSDLQTVWGHY